MINHLLDQYILFMIYTEDQIIKNDEKDISFLNYCINQEDLNKMSNFRL